MRISLAYNLRREDDPEQAEFLTSEQVDRLEDGLAGLGHEVRLVEVTVPLETAVERLLASEPDLVFNTAEGVSGGAREATFPAIYETLGLPYTGSGPSLLFVDLDKRLTERMLAARGIKVPRGVVFTPDHGELPDLRYPVIVKPNAEGSSKGITQDSVLETADEVHDAVSSMLEEYPQGVLVEEMIRGRELVVPMLEAWPGRLLEVVEHRFPDRGYDIYDYELKRDEAADQVETLCPAELDRDEEERVLDLARRVFDVMRCRDLGRVDIRLHRSGDPYFIEINPLPALAPEASLMTGARARGLSYERTLELIVQSACRRWGVAVRRTPAVVVADRERRAPCRELGVTVGSYPTGEHNAITDVAEVEVGHVTTARDDVVVPGTRGETTSVRTGVTAVVPCGDALFDNHLVAGGFILNGIGEMSGLIQVLQWGWLETPILLTNTMSVGTVHAGIIRHMIRRHPSLGKRIDVVIPVVGETNDGFLNDNRVPANTPRTAMEAIEAAAGGPVAQGSVGGGTGMISFDFAGGIGTSSRVLPEDKGGYTVGVLTQSNFGKMRNLTVDGAVVGRELDTMYPHEGRRGRQYGSVIVVVATDAPLLSTQLESLSKRAALGLGRVGSFARSTSGEIVCAFSTGNRVSRQDKQRVRQLDLEFVNDELINPLYEATMEATEEAVLNSIFCSAGQTGRLGRSAPALPTDAVLEILARGRDLRGAGGGGG